jgi:dihydroorotate dehydrogenase
MAGAGASIVQLYTSFGYRGVGTPRLLKDEITEGLQGKSWKDVVARDWEGKEMGWDEKRLEHETDALKREAEGLGQLLREAWEKDDTDRLVKEAQAVLTGKPSSRTETEADQSGQASAPAQQSQNLVETQHVAAIGAVPETPETPEQLLTIEAAVVPEPVTAPVEIQVEVVPTIPVVPEEDAWSSSVRSGQRRLV